MSEKVESNVNEEEPLGAGIDFADPNSRLAPWYLRPSHVVAAAVLAFLFCFMTYFPVWHTDLWAHLRFGETIAQTGHLPEHEAFPGIVRRP